MASRRIEDLTPELQEKFRQFDAAMKAAAIAYIVTCTARTVKEQVALYAQGREKRDTTNPLRKIAGLPPITWQANCHCVTWTLQSKHLVDLDDGNPDNDKSRAFDIAIVSEGRPTWDIKVSTNDNSVPDYDEAGSIGESVGLKWGGRFRKPDRPHFEV